MIILTSMPLIKSDLADGLLQNPDLSGLKAIFEMEHWGCPFSRFTREGVRAVWH
jgi:hypothetical protein